MTKCIDISENRRFSTVSPIAMFVFIGLFVIETALMKPGFAYLLALAVSYILTQIFFEYTPRFIFLFVKFIITNHHLSPNFIDKEYYIDHKNINSLKKIL
jgi:hypothetical protein